MERALVKTTMVATIGVLRMVSLPTTKCSAVTYEAACGVDEDLRVLGTPPLTYSVDSIVRHRHDSVFRAPDETARAQRPPRIQPASTSVVAGRDPSRHTVPRFKPG